MIDLLAEQWGVNSDKVFIIMLSAGKSPVTERKLAC